MRSAGGRGARGDVQLMCNLPGARKIAERKRVGTAKVSEALPPRQRNHNCARARALTSRREGAVVIIKIRVVAVELNH